MKFPLKTLCSLSNTAVTVLKKVCYTFFKKKKEEKIRKKEVKIEKIFKSWAPAGDLRPLRGGHSVQSPPGQGPAGRSKKLIEFQMFIIPILSVIQGS